MKRLNPHHVFQAKKSDFYSSVSLYANSMAELQQCIKKARVLLKTAVNSQLDQKNIMKIDHFLQSDTVEDLQFPVAFFVSEFVSGYIPLPFHVKSLAVVSTSFHVKPLLKWLQREHRYAVLLLGEDEATVFGGSLGHFKEIASFHYQELAGSFKGLLHALDRKLVRAVLSLETPVILAGDFDMIEDFRRQSRYRNLVEEPIINPDDYEHISSLQKVAIQVMEPIFERREEMALSLYFMFEKTGRCSTELDSLIVHALEGRVRHLFVSEDESLWGEINMVTGSFSRNLVQVDAFDDDVLDDLAEIVYKSGGQVTVLRRDRMPHQSLACAILRKQDSSLEQRAGEFLAVAQ